MKGYFSIPVCCLTFIIVACGENNKLYISKIKKIKATNGDNLERIVDHHILAAEFLETNFNQHLDLKNIVKHIKISDIQFEQGDKQAHERMSTFLLKTGAKYPDIEKMSWRVAYKKKGVTIIEVCSDNIILQFPIFDFNGNRIVNFSNIKIINKKRGIIDISQLDAAHEIIHFIGNDSNWI